VADFGRFKFTGAVAWLLWLAVHIYFLIGFRNRALVLFQWAWSWLTFQRGARLITGAVPALPAVRDLRPDGTLEVPQAERVIAIEEEKLSG